MFHFASRLGDLIHFHPLARFSRARQASDVPDRSEHPADARARATTSDDLSYLGLKSEVAPSDAWSDLGKFALLSGDNPEDHPELFQGSRRSGD